MKLKVTNRKAGYEIYSKSEFQSLNKLSVGEYDQELPEQVTSGLKNYFNTHLESGCLNYPSDHSKITEELKALLSNYCQSPLENIILTAGATESLRLIFSSFIAPEHSTLFPIPSYSNALNLLRNQTERIDTPTCMELSDLTDILNTKCYDLVYICLPNNPTGYLFNEEDIRKISSLYKNTLFVIDGCYLEYEVDVQNFNLNQENVITIRTFSKAFGLAGLRIGYLYSHNTTIKKLNTLRDPHLPTEISKHISTLALKSIDDYKSIWLEMKATRAWFMEELKYIGIDTLPDSRGMFIMAKLPQKNNSDIYNQLKNNDDIIIKPLKGDVFGLDSESYIRIGLAKKSTLETLLRCLKKYI